MFLEYRINYVDGCLEIKTDPKGKWREAVGIKAEIVKKFLASSDNEQIKIFNIIKTAIDRK